MKHFTEQNGRGWVEFSAIAASLGAAIKASYTKRVAWVYLPGRPLSPVRVLRSALPADPGAWNAFKLADAAGAVLGPFEEQKELALALLEWHGGMSSGLYAVGSCMLSDCDKGRAYSPGLHRGHDVAARRAVSELRDLKGDAKHPECVTEDMEREAAALADRLERYL